MEKTIGGENAEYDLLEKKPFCEQKKLDKSVKKCPDPLPLDHDYFLICFSFNENCASKLTVLRSCNKLHILNLNEKGIYCL